MVASVGMDSSGEESVGPISTDADSSGFTDCSGSVVSTGVSVGVMDSEGVSVGVIGSCGMDSVGVPSKWASPCCSTVDFSVFDCVKSLQYPTKHLRGAVQSVSALHSCSLPLPPTTHAPKPNTTAPQRAAHKHTRLARCIQYILVSSLFFLRSLDRFDLPTKTPVFAMLQAEPPLV